MKVSYEAEHDPQRNKMKALSWTVVGGCVAAAPAAGFVANPSLAANLQVLAAAAIAAQNRAQGGVPVVAGLPPVPPPAAVVNLPPPPLPVAQAFAEVEVPTEHINDVISHGGLEEIKRKAGGDILVELVPDGGATNGSKKMKIRGSEVSASLAACLLLERVAEVV